MKGRPITLPEPWRSLVQRHGGTVAFCAQFPIPHQVFYRWVKHRRLSAFHGVHAPSPANRAALVSLFEAAALSLPPNLQ